VCPLVRFAQDVDLEGRATGVVWPLIPIQDRVNQTVFDLLVAQTYGSFKVRTITGMAPEFETDQDGKPILGPDGRPKVKPGMIPIQDRVNEAGFGLLVAQTYGSFKVRTITGMAPEFETDQDGKPILGPDGRPKVKPVMIPSSSRFLVSPDTETRFGQLDETPLGGFLEAIEAGVRQMSVISQTPPHYLLGSIVNLSAEALAAAEAALTRAVREYQDVLGESWELVLALAGSLLGLPYDREAQISWMDHESRSLAQTVDALGKAVQMLQVPPRALWNKIPGVTEGDVERWRAEADAQDSATRLAERMAQVMRRGSDEDATPAD